MSLSNVTDIKIQLDTVEAVWFTKNQDLQTHLL